MNPALSIPLFGGAIPKGSADAPCAVLACGGGTDAGIAPTRVCLPTAAETDTWSPPPLEGAMSPGFACFASSELLTKMNLTRYAIRALGTGVAKISSAQRAEAGQAGGEAGGGGRAGEGGGGGDGEAEDLEAHLVGGLLAEGDVDGQGREVAVEEHALDERVGDGVVPVAGDVDGVAGLEAGQAVERGVVDVRALPAEVPAAVGEALGLRIVAA